MTALLLERFASSAEDTRRRSPRSPHSRRVALLRAAYQGGKDIVHDERFVVGPGEGRHLDLGNFEALVLATAPQTSGEFTLLQLQREPPDFGPPLHLHHHPRPRRSTC